MVIPASAGASGQSTPVPSENPILVMDPSQIRPSGAVSRASSNPLAWASRPWTDRQERLALLYNEQGLTPDEIAARLGVSRYQATQIVLAARERRPKGPAVLRSGPSQRTRRPA